MSMAFQGLSGTVESEQSCALSRRRKKRKKKEEKKTRQSLALSTKEAVEKLTCWATQTDIVQELCESRGGRPGLSVLTSLLVSVDIKNY